MKYSSLSLRGRAKHQATETPGSFGEGPETRSCRPAGWRHCTAFQPSLRHRHQPHKPGLPPLPPFKPLLLHTPRASEEPGQAPGRRPALAAGGAQRLLRVRTAPPQGSPPTPPLSRPPHSPEGKPPPPSPRPHLHGGRQRPSAGAALRRPAARPLLLRVWKAGERACAQHRPAVGAHPLCACARGEAPRSSRGGGGEWDVVGVIWAGVLLPKVGWQLAIFSFPEEGYAAERVPTRGRRAQGPSGQVGLAGTLCRSLRLRTGWPPSCVGAPYPSAGLPGSAHGETTVMNKIQHMLFRSYLRRKDPSELKKPVRCSPLPAPSAVSHKTLRAQEGW